MRGSFKKLRKIYAQNITVKIEKAFQFLVCVDLREFHRKLISFLAFYLRQLAKYNMDTYIQINIILKGQEYIGLFFLRKYIFHSPENIFLQKEKFTYISIHRDSMLRYEKIKFIKGILNCFP